MTNLDFHIVKRIRQRIVQGGDNAALKHKQNGQWQAINWHQFGEQLDELSMALLAQGIGVQDKIAIFPTTCHVGRLLILPLYRSVR